MTFSDVIKEIIQLKGKEILKDEQRFNALFKDLAPKMDTELKIVKRLCDEKMLERFYNIAQAPDYSQKEMLKALDRDLKNGLGFSDSWAQCTLAAFCEAFKINYVYPSTKRQNSNQQITTPDPTGTNSNTSQVAKNISVGSKPNNGGAKKNKFFVPILVGLICIVVIAIILSGLTKKDENNNVINNDISYDEILKKETSDTITGTYVEDYDKDGNQEAFITTNNSDDPDYDALWFVTERGAIAVEGASVGHMPQILYTSSGYKLVPWRAGYGATICFGLYRGQVKQLEIYVDDIYQDSDGTIYAVKEVFRAEGEIHQNYVCEFNENSFELELTDDYFESDPSEDDHFCSNRNEAPFLESDSNNIEESGNDYPVTDNQDSTFIDSKLYEIVANNVNDTIQEWCYMDFDGDGKKEAFVSTGDDGTYYTEDGEKSLWFINSDGEVECLIDKSSYWYFNEEPFIIDDCALLYVDARHGYYGIYGVKNNKAVEVSVPGDFYWIAQENGVITAADKREERAHVLEFDKSKMAFVDTGKTVLNN